MSVNESSGNVGDAHNRASKHIKTSVNESLGNVRKKKEERGNKK